LITSHLGGATSAKGFDPGVGDYTASVTDATVSVVGPALAITRSYNSQDPRTSSLFGAGWSTAYDMAAVEDDDGTGDLVVTYPDGHTARFGTNPGGITYSSPQGMYATFQLSRSGGYTLTDRGGTTYTFGLQAGTTWKLTSITDADGRSETLSYNQGQLATVTNTASHRSLYFTWTGAHVTQVATDPVATGGQPLTWTYGYSGNNLTSVCPPTSPSKCTAYIYTSGTNSGSHYRTTVLDAQPAAYWRLANTSGTTATDEVGANMGTDNGTDVNVNLGGSPLTAGSSTTSTFLNGADADIQLPNNLVSATSYLTVQMTFQTYPNGGPGVLFSTGHTAIGQTSSASSGAMPVLYIGTDGKLYGQFWTGSVAPIVSSKPVNDSGIHHVTLVGAGNSQSMYLDGQLVGTKSGAIVNQDPMDFVGAGYINTSAWVNGPAVGWSYFSGNVSEVAYYTHPLGTQAIAEQNVAATQSAAELTSITTPGGAQAATISYDNINDRAKSVTDVNGGTSVINAPATTGSALEYRADLFGTNPIGYWPLNESAGTQANDDAVHATLSGPYGNGSVGGPGTYANVTLGEPGHFAGLPDTAAGFDGTDSSVTLPNIGPGPTAVALWFKTTQTGGILVNDETYGALLYIGTDGLLYTESGSNSSPLVKSSTPVNDGKWHFAVADNYFNVGGSLHEELYLDGSPVGTCDGICDGSMLNVRGPVTLGTGILTGLPGQAASSGHSWFNGAIADFSAWESTPSDAAIAQMYSDNQRISSHPTPSTTVSVTNPDASTSSYAYDLTNGGRVITATDGLGNTTTYTYDSNGFLSSAVLPDGDGTTTQHDARGNVLSRSTTDGLGDFSTAYYTYPPVGTYTVTDPRNDAPLTMIDPDGYGPADTSHQVTYTYTATGDLATSTNAINAATTTTYTAGTEPATNGGTEPPGLTATQTDPLGNATQNSYDSAGDLTKTVSPTGLATTYTYDNLGRRTGQTQTSDSFPNGVTTSYTYNDAGQLLTQTGPATTDAVTGTTHTPQLTNTYDLDGDLLTQATADTTGADQTRTTQNTYNTLDELATTTDQVGRETRYNSHDAFGDPTSVTNPGGNTYTYTYNSNQQQVSETLANWTGNSATPASPTNLVVDSRSYDPDSLLASDTDAMGRTTQYSYNGEHHLTSDDIAGYIDPTNQYSTYNDVWLYDNAGNLTEYGAGTGLSVEYSYDNVGRITQETYDPFGPFEYSLQTQRRAAPQVAPGGPSIDRITNYTYNNDNQLLTKTETNGSVNEETDYTHDALGDITSQTVKNGTANQLTTSTYDERGLPTSTTDPRGNASGATPADYTTTYVYDAAGHLVTTTAPQVNTETNGGSATPVHPVSQAGYDTFGDQTSTSDPDGNITSYTYDADSELLGVSQPAYTAPGTTTSITPTTKYTYTSLGQPETETTPRGYTTTNTYDQLGDVVQQVQPAVNGTSPTRTYSYDNDGERLSATDPTGAQTQATYDALGEQLTATTIVRQPTQVADTTTYTYNPTNFALNAPTSIALPGGQTTKLTYDHGDDVRTVTDPAGDLTSYNYDADQNLTQVTLADATASTATYDAADQQIGTAQLDATGKTLSSTSATYDLAGNLVSTTDQNGAATSYSYDAGNHLTQQVQPVTATTHITTGYGYDAAGHTTRYTDGNHNNTVYSYNTLGLPESSIEPTVPGFTSAADSTTTTGYDADGNATAVTQPGGVIQTATYDPLDRQISLAGSGAEAATATQTYGYDLAGRLTSVTAPGGTDAYTYDDAGNLLSATGPSGTSSDTYNSDHQLTSRTDKAGTTGFTYDTDGRLATLTDPITKTTASYGYNSLSEPTSITYGTGAASQTATYNSAHELTSQTVTAPGSPGTSEASINYGYDLDGHVTSQTTTGTAGASANSYTYDQAGRLASSTTGGSTTTYSYDGDGNRTQAGATTATYNARDQLVSTGSTSYNYTARGTLASTVTGSTTTTYRDDAYGQFASVGSTSYSYDGLGRLASTGSATFAYDGTDTSAVSDGTDTFDRTPSGQVASVGTPAGGALAFTDQHGDITGLFTPTGTALAGSKAFDPYGQVTAQSGTQADLGYQGGWNDPTTGDVGTASRWYNPATGGFTNQDSLQILGGTAVQANQYAYGNDDPLDNSDPTGHYAPSPIDTACADAPEACAAAEDCPWCDILGGAFDLGWWLGQLLYPPNPGKFLNPGDGPGDWQDIPISALQQLHGDDIQYPWPGSPSKGRSPHKPGHGPNNPRKPYRPRPPAPTPQQIADRPPINGHPSGQTDPNGDIETPENGNNTGDSLTGDAPINVDTVATPNPAENLNPYRPGDAPSGSGIGLPQVLPPAQAQLSDSPCTGGLWRFDGENWGKSAQICDFSNDPTVYTDPTSGNSYNFRTAPDSAIFWSGFTEGVGGDMNARSFANSNGGTTLEMFLEDNLITMPKWEDRTPAAVKAWTDASIAFASGASGEVRVLLGQQRRVDNVFEKDELPALLANQNVTSIIAVDPYTLEQTELFRR
jgi:RHS repeat-associated protein